MIRRGNKRLFITTCYHYYHALPIVFTLPIRRNYFLTTRYSAPNLVFLLSSPSIF